jgi:4a-hydroxytetrahydrobiopterin dehydratase
MNYDVTLYTRKDCPLCDEAKSSIRAAASLHRLPITLHEVDIDTDPDLRARYTDDVPVIHVDGVEAFRHRVTPEEFMEYFNSVGAPAPGRAAEGGRAHTSLAAETCVPCRGGVPPLEGEELAALARQLGNGWRVVDGHHLEKELAFPDFAQALAFTNRVGALAEEQGHHPDIYLAWGKVRITIWTHKIGGLSRGDFVLAAKIDQRS